MIVAPRNTEPFGPVPRQEPVPSPAKAARAGRRNRADDARDTSVSKRLTRKQVTALVIMAKQAWEQVRVVRDDVGSFETWRQAEAVRACGQRISQAEQRHYSAIKSHFLNLGGKAGKAFVSAMRESTEAERIALAKLREECEERGLEMSYPEAIGRRQFKKSLADLTAKEVWCLVFTVRNRRHAVEEQKADGQGRDYELKQRPVKGIDSIPAADALADEEDPF